MKNGTWRASPLALVSALVIAAAAILSFFLAKHSVDSQNQALLREDVTQAAGYVSSLTSTLSSTLDALAPGVTSTNGSAAGLRSPGQSARRPVRSPCCWPGRAVPASSPPPWPGTGSREARCSTTGSRPPSTRRGRASCPDPSPTTARRRPSDWVSDPRWSLPASPSTKWSRSTPSWRPPPRRPRRSTCCAAAVYAARVLDEEPVGPGQYPGSALDRCNVRGSCGRRIGLVVACGRGQEPAGGPVPQRGAVCRPRLRPAPGAGRGKRDRSRRAPAALRQRPRRPSAPPSSWPLKRPWSAANDCRRWGR